MGKGGGKGGGLLNKEKMGYDGEWNEKRKTAYKETWNIEMKQACIEEPGFCCLSALCPCCVSYHNRKEVLRGDLSKYTCCMGTFPCSGHMSEHKCPAFCLGCEVVMCFPQSVITTRWMLQDEMQIANTKCDNCLIGFMIAMQMLSCILAIPAMFVPGLDEAADIFGLLADFSYCSVCACMQAQHKNQIKFRNEHPEAINPVAGAPLMFAPAQQAMHHEGGTVIPDGWRQGTPEGGQGPPPPSGGKPAKPKKGGKPGKK